MNNFTYCNPTNIVFGKGTIAALAVLIPAESKVLITYGGGSIMKNGVYAQVKEALAGRKLVEFGGIEPNPRYETLMKAVELARAEQIDLLLAVGGGSVLDGTKFIAAAIDFSGEPWEILSKGAKFTKAVPIGSVLTLPATGSEANGNAVISRNSTQQKLAFASPLVYPRFSILDPETTYTLPRRQVSNGIVDAIIHVMEQYMTFDVNAPLQDRQAEALLSTLIEVGPKVLANPTDYDARANLMWCATQALNMLIGCGVPQDWASHGIGHELTALYGIDHAQSLAIAWPGVATHQKERKKAKLAQYAERVWQIRDGDENQKADQAIAKTEAFFRSLDMGTRLSDYSIPPTAPHDVAARLAARNAILGEHGAITSVEVEEILTLRL